MRVARTRTVRNYRGMIKMVHKFAHREDLRQEIHNIAVVRFKIPERTIPVVATAEREQLTLFWWDYRSQDQSGNRQLPRWRWFPLPHRPISMDQPYGQDPTLWNWSRQIRLVAFGSTVLLVAKRQRAARPELLIYRFEWDARTSEMVQDPQSPFVIPTDNLRDRQSNTPTFVFRTGDEIWAGYDTASSQLLMVTQALVLDTDMGVTIHCLALLTADLSEETAALDNPAIWTILKLGIGGYDSDAILSSGQLHVVYRESPSAIATEVDFWHHPLSGLPYTHTVDLTATDLGDQDNLYEPLTYKVFDLPSLTLANQLADIPGGEHPRIQSVFGDVRDRSIMYLSYSRIQRGAIDIELRYVGAPHGIYYQLTIRPHVEMIRTVLVLCDPNQGVWLRGHARSFSTLHIPRQAHFDPHGLHVFLVNLEGSIDMGYTYRGQLTMTTRHEFQPVWMTTDSPRPLEIDGEKVDLIDLLYHAPYTRTLDLARLKVYKIPQGLDVRPHEEAYLDINHELILQRPHPDTWPENGQFWPFNRTPPEDHLGPILHLLISGEDISQIIVAQPTEHFDNTIGTALVMDRSPPALSFYAYTDAGDGGLRVIFADEGLTPGLRPAGETEYFNANAVSGPGLAEEQWVTISDSESPDLPARLPYKFGDLTVPNSHALGLDRMLLYLLPGEPEPEKSYDIDAAVAENMETTMESLNPSLTASTESNYGLRASWEMTPGSVFVNKTVSFNVSDSSEPDPAFSIQQYQWDFGDGQTASGEQVTHTYTTTGRKRVRLTVITDNPNPNLNTQSTEADVSVQARIFGTLFEPVELLNSSFDPTTMAGLTLLDVGIRDMDLDFSRYRMGFRHTSIYTGPPPWGAPERVLLEIRDTHDEFWQFNAENRGQGRIQYSFRMRFFSKDVTTRGILGGVFEIDSIEAIWEYGRPFTPAVTMSDQRQWSPMEGEIHPETLQDSQPAALATKPIEAAWTRAVRADIEISPKGLGGWLLVDSVVAILTAISYWALIATIAAFEAAYWYLMTIPIGGPVLAAAVFVALMVFIHVTVFAAIEWYAERELREMLNSDQFRDGLDGSGILTYAGEGLAEIIAVKALEKRNQLVDPSVRIEPPHPDEGWGQVRHIPNIWQQIFVTNGKCRVLVR